ncbi:hypothetical protein EAF07_01035 [Streptococcus hillyeri]|uniref:Uncharacterized protein n=1 Tax=Streptococcus hillyeri TaxID=2282420 RepID=A0A3L9DVN8_9STRE|nr:hypothetical protein EAF07_01035 [Streptococcus hillyeri]
MNLFLALIIPLSFWASSFVLNGGTTKPRLRQLLTWSLIIIYAIYIIVTLVSIYLFLKVFMYSKEPFLLLLSLVGVVSSLIFIWLLRQLITLL